MLETGEQPQQYVACNWNYTASNCPLLFNRLEGGQNVLLNVYNPLPQNLSGKIISFRVPRSAQQY
jgi:hypothetical protein